jgi:amicyanin
VSKLRSTRSWLPVRVLGLVVLLSLLSSLLVVACGGGNETTTSAGITDTTAATASTGSQGQPEGAQVVISDYKYEPAEITIKAGESVTWTNQDSVQHNAAADENAFEGPLLSKGESYTFTFDAPGVYPYHCTPHPFMKATVTVE